MKTDPYSYPGTHVLRNRYDIRDKDELTKLEDFIFELKFIQLMKREKLTIPGFTRETFLGLHKYLCGTLYDWAGEYRTTDIGILYDHVAYESPETMPEKVEGVFDYIESHDCFRGESNAEAIKNLALVFSELKVLQPFRDMNTRTSMLFAVLLGMVSGHYVDFTEFTEERLSMTSIQYRDGNPDPAVLEFAFHTYDTKGLLVLPEVEVECGDKADNTR